jgi:hypothetical protein
MLATRSATPGAALWSSAELRVELDSDDLDHDEIVVRRASDDGSQADDDLIGLIDEHLKTAKRHPAGTTDRLLQADRARPY